MLVGKLSTASGASSASGTLVDAVTSGLDGSPAGDSSGASDTLETSASSRISGTDDDSEASAT